MDKVDAKILGEICSKYIEQFELLLSVEPSRLNSINIAWDREKTDFYSGKTKKFKSEKELNTHYYVYMVELLDSIEKDNSELYEICINALNQILKSKGSYSKKAGLIIHQNDRYTNTEYFVNYIFSGKALDRCKAFLGSFGIK